MIDFSPLLRHEKIALCASGGKDSLACVYLMRPFKDKITIYHLDTGDLLPEIMEIVDHIKSFWPRFVHIKGNVDAWIEANGMPTDLLPYTAHPLGEMTGQRSTKLVTRYDCCFANLMWPCYARIKADGNTLMIRGTKACDMKKLPADDGANPDGVELFLPVKDWSHEDVFTYLRSVGAPIARIYDHVTNSPECARCPAWWGEKRASYLRRFHPGLFEGYMDRMRKVAAEIDGPIKEFQREMAEAVA